MPPILPTSSRYRSATDIGAPHAPADDETFICGLQAGGGTAWLGGEARTDGRP